MAAVPLQSELDIATSRIAVLDRVAPQVVAAIGQGRSIQKLEISNGAVAMDLRHPSRAEQALRMEPVPALVSMVIPRPGILLEPFPFVPADQVAPIGAINRSLVEVGPVEVLAKLTRQHDVGIEVKNPIVAANLIESPLNQPSLIERPIPPMVIRKHIMGRMAGKTEIVSWSSGDVTTTKCRPGPSSRGGSRRRSHHIPHRHKRIQDSLMFRTSPITSKVAITSKSTALRPTIPTRK